MFNEKPRVELEDDADSGEAWRVEPQGLLLSQVLDSGVSFHHPSPEPLGQVVLRLPKGFCIRRAASSPSPRRELLTGRGLVQLPGNPGRQ